MNCEARRLLDYKSSLAARHRMISGFIDFIGLPRSAVSCLLHAACNEGAPSSKHVCCLPKAASILLSPLL